MDVKQNKPAKKEKHLMFSVICRISSKHQDKKVEINYLKRQGIRQQSKEGVVSGRSMLYIICMFENVSLKPNILYNSSALKQYSPWERILKVSSAYPWRSLRPYQEIHEHWWVNPLASPLAGIRAVVSNCPSCHCILYCLPVGKNEQETMETQSPPCP